MIYQGFGLTVPIPVFLTPGLQGAIEHTYVWLDGQPKAEPSMFQFLKKFNNHFIDPEAMKS